MSDPLARSSRAESSYTFRRRLTWTELLPAIGVGVAAGLFAFYVTRLLLQRTPLTVERSTRVRRHPASLEHRLERSAGA